MKVAIISPALTILAMNAALPEGESCAHVFLKAVALMPTAGWSFVMDSIEVSENASRIRVMLTAHAPEREQPPEPTPQLVSVNLGRPSPGRHLVEIHLRSSPDAVHTLRQAFVISVSDSILDEEAM